ncbi:zinc-binding alcohol dehydrogenase [Deinococcus sp.]|uniref:zinc-dependent alcohol dehydrogenase n=1 Tax=Deinococcus sp. TaxID=47478 RepID=UPI00286E5A8A|nr:zinc-binding alcohol dehydrogenase [Deinococcus sp.]
MNAQVLILTGTRQLGWESRPLPSPRPGQVLVESLLSAVSVASELSLIEGRVDLPLPRKIGYQTLGRVVQAGEGVSLPHGSRVMTTSGHASAAVLDAHRCIAVPPHIPDRVALAAVLGEETHKGIRRVAPLPHERVLVAGAGLLGLLTVFNLTRRGMSNVSVTEPDPARRELAQAFGAAVLSYGKQVGCAQDETFDAGFECSTSPEGFTDLLNRTRSEGRVCVLSDGNWGQLVLPLSFHRRELSVVASSDGEKYQAYADWLWTHPEPLLERLFQFTIRPPELIACYARLRQLPRPISVVVEWR